MGTEVILSKDEFDFVSQARTQIECASFKTETIVQRIAESISVPKDNPDVQVTPNDVLAVVNTSISMGLNPLLGGIYGFKGKDNRLVLGVSLKGWRQALAQQKNCVSIDYPADRQGRLMQKRINISTQYGTKTKDLIYFEWSTCVIKKRLPSGEIGEFTGTAFFDEEFDSSKPTWLKNCKRMLQNRALCIAASNAYGFGAYETAEVEAIQEKEEKEEVIETEATIVPDDVKVEHKTSRGKAALLKKQKTQLLEAMEKAENREQLVAIFKSANEELQQDQEVINKSQEIAEKF